MRIAAKSSKDQRPCLVLMFITGTVLPMISFVLTMDS